MKKNVFFLVLVFALLGCSESSDNKTDNSSSNQPNLPETPACEHEIQYTVLEQKNLHGSGDYHWEKQNATVIHDMKSFEDYLNTLREAHLGEFFDGKDHSSHFVFDEYLEKYKDFDFNENMLVALEGGSQPSGGYGMRIEKACDNKVEYNVTWCDSPDIAHTADIGFPFILASFVKGDYDFIGGVNSKVCK